MRRLKQLWPSPATAIAFVALFAALAGGAVALPGNNTVTSGDIVNSTIKSKDIKNSQVKAQDIRSDAVRSSDVKNDALTGDDITETSLGKVPNAAAADAATNATNAGNADTVGGNTIVFATINGQAANGSASVLNFGGEQIATSPPGVTAERQVSGTYLVTFRANTGTGKFVNVNSVDDLAIQATGENFSNASAEAISAAENEVVIRVRLRTFNGANPANEDFSVQFYARTTS
jgi:hypothetical protein